MVVSSSIHTGLCPSGKDLLHNLSFNRISLIFILCICVPSIAVDDCVFCLRLAFSFVHDVSQISISVGRRRYVDFHIDLAHFVNVTLCPVHFINDTRALGPPLARASLTAL